ncbi:MAG TPA: nicotinamide riboside transporter PnuC [Flavipsychrobacter sp.]|jgi:nicotinamide mononucleotide transporter|nr:nicotinamide riboside transporter PnuC [Flavipsychrobacter sp.]
MNFQSLATEFVQQLFATSLTEYVAVFFGILSVLYAKKNHVLLYPTGIISTSLFVWIMSEAGLYAESALNSYYFIMSLYGWWLWHQHKESENAKAITKASKRDWMVVLVITLFGWALLYFILKNYTTSDVAGWDAWVSATAWAGMWLLAKHKLENWLLLNISNLIAIPLQVHKGIPLTALLTVFLFIIAIFGYLRWRKSYYAIQIH